MSLPRHLIILPLVIAVTGLSQAEITTPGLGFVYDKSAQSFRPLLGIPGASVFGGPLDLGFPVSAAAISPAQDFALAVDAQAHDLRIVRFRSRDTAIVTSIAGAGSHPDRIVLSPGGSAAALLYEASQHIQIIAGLPSNPNAKRQLQLPGSGVPESISISDDGELAILLLNGTVWIANGASTPVPLSFPGQIAATAIRPGSHQAVFVGEGRVYLARDLATSLAFDEVPGTTAIGAEPFAVTFSPDGRSVHVLMRSGFLATLELESGVVATIFCRCTPSGLDRLSPGSVFRLTELSGSPVMLFDATERDPQVWFVPSPTPDSGSERSQQ